MKIKSLLTNRSIWMLFYCVTETTNLIWQSVLESNSGSVTSNHEERYGYDAIGGHWPSWIKK